MTSHFQHPNSLASRRCEICHCEIPFSNPISFKSPSPAVCQSAECQNILKQKSLMSEMAFNTYLRTHRQVLQERHVRIEKENRLKESNLKENRILFKAVEDRVVGEQSVSKQLVILPLGLSKLSQLSEDRKERYRKHLETMIEEALQYDNADQVPVDKLRPTYQDVIDQDQKFAAFPELKGISEQFCMKCKGGCCPSGDNHAYITAATIRRLFDLTPELTPDEVLETYLSYLPEHSAGHSCINQGPMGCVLPRELRSSTCNYYFCDSVVNFQKKAKQEGEVKPAIVVQRENTHWEKTKLTAPNKVVSVALIYPNKYVDMDELMEIL